MTDPSICPACGAPLAQGRGGDLCPAGLLHAAMGSASPPSPSAELPGTRIGRYKLLEQIGEGGCGVVWMAEQDEPVRRRVALKIIKPGMDIREVVARFEAERQALAMMEHADIHDDGRFLRILKVEDRVEGEIAPLAEVREDIVAILQQQQRDDLLRQWQEEARVKVDAWEKGAPTHRRSVRGSGG